MLKPLRHRAVISSKPGPPTTNLPSGLRLLSVAFKLWYKLSGKNPTKRVIQNPNKVYRNKVVKVVGNPEYGGSEAD
jgi:hypothetical protein